MRGGRPTGVVRVLPKGRITMPKAIRERLGIEVGDDLLLEVVGEREARIIVLPRPTSLKDLRGLVHPRRLLDEQTARQAIREGRGGLAHRWEASRRSATLVDSSEAALREAGAAVDRPVK